LHQRATFNPLSIVVKSETRGRERRLRRALTQAGIDKLIPVSGKRRLPYLLALYTRLRESENRKLDRLHGHLHSAPPFVAVRSAPTKNSRTAVLPLVPVIVEGLKRHREAEWGFNGRVFRRGVPTPRSLTADLIAAGIEPIDNLGRRVDFHSMRHTFATLL